MKPSHGAYALLLLIALAAGLASPTEQPESAVPSSSNAGPHGTRLLFRYLQATGRDVRTIDGPLTALPPTIKTLLLAGPEGQPLSDTELEAVRTFVAAGGTLVFLRPRHGISQPGLDRWLALSASPAPSRAPTLDDPMGANEPTALLPDVGSMRVRADQGLTSGAAAAIPLTPSGAVWWLPVGNGQVFIGAGADLAQAARLHLGGNLAFWASLPSPIAFDEFHHRAKPLSSSGRTAAVLGAQLGLVALALALAFGARLGPARPTPRSIHRATVEYVESMAALAQSARVERELAVRMVERLGQQLGASDPALDQAAAAVRTPHDYLALSRRCAAREAQARGFSPRLPHLDTQLRARSEPWQ